ncbi:MAG: TonB-dependent receptor [Bdellovibrionota bacterium]|nr:MAG: TonB-dependent receptor [Bdellovibrionota bacterium]
MNYRHYLVLFVGLIFASVLKAEPQESHFTVEVDAPRVAVTEAPGTFTAISSQLLYEPEVDLQARNFGEAQGDVSIRGGIFEDTGVRIGSTSIYDPQTGHYTLELPVDPRMLGPVQVLTGSEQALYGFNSTAGTLSYGLREIEEGGTIRAGAGDFHLNFQDAYAAALSRLDDGSRVGIDVSAARSEGNGTRTDGDHEFERFSGRLQAVGDTYQTDILVGYQNKEFSWPYLYAVREIHEAVGSSGIEQDDTDTTFAALNHRVTTGEDSYFELSGYFRDLRDDYEFDRFQPGLFNPYRHRTRVYSVGASGRESYDRWALNYGSQILFDEIESSALVFGDFDSRAYGRVVIAPEYTVSLSEGYDLVIYGGTAWDDTDRDEDEWSPLGGVQLLLDESMVERVYVEYSETTRVPGYTALNSNPNGGLFRGNAELARQRTRNIETGATLAISDFAGTLAVFGREDDDLVDWTYKSGESPAAARVAQNVDIDTFGVQSIVEWRGERVRLFSGYGYLLKDDSYPSDSIDASFYALNFPKHRLTFGAVWSLCDQFELRLDNEYRVQEANALRTGARHPVLTTVLARWMPPSISGMDVTVAVDNLFDENFEEVPGVPGQQRLFSGSVAYRW